MIINQKLDLTDRGLNEMATIFLVTAHFCALCNHLKFPETFRDQIHAMLGWMMRVLLLDHQGWF